MFRYNLSRSYASTRSALRRAVRAAGSKDRTVKLDVEKAANDATYPDMVIRPDGTEVTLA